MSEKTYRVVQWATGNIGTKSLRAVIEHPNLELVGLYVHSPDKVGKDAGELCGIGPTGVIATNSITDVLALDADCVLYMQQGCDFDDVCRILESGANIVTTRGEFHRPASLDAAVRERVEAACTKGGTSIHSTGSSPGFITEALPLVLLSMTRSLDELRIDEFADMSSRNSPDLLFRVMGFGSDPAKFDARRFGHIAQSFGPSLSALADAVGLPIDSVEPGGDIAVATHDVEIAAGTVKAGTVAAQRPRATCLHDGRPLLRFQANWYVTTDLEPACELQETGWRVQVLGDTPLDVEIRFPVEPERYPLVSPGFSAHPAVNAVPVVCEAEPGMRTTFELGKVIPTFARDPDAWGPTVTPDLEQLDFFSDPSLLEDPYPYFEQLRAKCPVTPIPHHGVVAVSGYDEATDVYRDIETFSSCNSVVGPFAMFPVPLEGDDISEIIERYRDQLPMNEHMVTMDPPEHTRQRALLMRLLSPKRLKQNEDFMWRYADRQLDEFVADGRCEFISAYSQPFAMLVVADLLGVPEADFQRFREGFGLIGTTGELGDERGPGLNALAWLDDYFATYIEDRRREPRSDVLTDLALAKYPDGSTPDVTAVVRSATFLFAAGQETTARLLATALKYLAEYPELQDELREHRERIPDFVEEALRIESPVKADFRLARRAATIGGVDIEPGTPVMLLNGAANRDPRRFECPAEFRLDRPNAKAHIAFGRGHHACPGGPLARTEGHISVERILHRTRDIRLSEEHHGPAGARRFDYEPTWVLRGLHELHIEFTPVDG